MTYIMEFKEYLQIIKKKLNLFLTIIILIVAGASAYFYFQPIFYNVSLTLNITRIGTQQTQDFRYDNFYRLQADEKFTETVTEWFKSPRILADIHKDAGLENKTIKIAAEKRSSQIVAIKFSTAAPEAAKKISASAVKVISQNIQNLNKDQKDETWFEIVAGDPVIAKNIPNYKIIFLASLLAGIFLGFWTVMVRHYWE